MEAEADDSIRLRFYKAEFQFELHCELSQLTEPFGLLCNEAWPEELCNGLSSTVSLWSGKTGQKNNCVSKTTILTQHH